MTLQLRYVMVGAAAIFTMVAIPVTPVWAAESSGQPPKLSETEILSLLPEGAKLADDIPQVQFGIPEAMAQRRASVRYADVDGDGQDEIVVAYYAKPQQPPSPEQTPEEQMAAEAYYSRAHVGVLHWDGQKYQLIWDSKGFGSHFVGGVGQGHPESEQREISATYFNVEDLTGDGIPEIMCARAGYSAMGQDFSVWTWDKSKGDFQRVASIDAVVRIRKVDGKKEIVQDCDHKGEPLQTPVAYRWEQTTRAFEARPAQAPAKE